MSISQLIESDLIFEPKIITEFLENSEKNLVFFKKTNNKINWPILCDSKKNLKDWGHHIPKNKISGDMITIYKISKNLLNEIYKTPAKEFWDSILKISKKIPMKCELIDALWDEIDTMEDLKRVKKKTYPKINKYLR